MNFLYKTIGIIILVFTVSCSAQQEINQVIEIEYQATTRGSSEMIQIISNKLSYKTNNSLKELILDEKKIRAIQSVVSDINLAEIKHLTAPSNNRFHDGALIASITIQKEEHVYTSSNFDHGNPPKELKPLIDLLNKYLN
jgi:hypothetical protein